MPRDGSGTYNLPAAYPFVTGTLIDSSDMNDILSDVADALTQSDSRDGQGAATSAADMGGNKITNGAVGTVRTDYPTVGQVQDGTPTYLTSVAGTNTITATAPNSLAAYVTGQAFRFIAANTNSGAVTLNINSIGAVNVTKSGTTALSGSEIPSGAMVDVRYDGTRFQMIPVATSGGSTYINAQDIGSYSSTGTNTYALSILGSRTAPSSYQDRQLIFWRPANANTSTTVTANVETLGAHQVYMNDGTTLPAVGFFTTSQTYIMEYLTTGTKFRMIYPSSVASGSSQALTPQTYTGDATYTFAHTIGSRPPNYKVVFECLLADNNWSVGDYATPFGEYTMWADSSNFYIRTKNVQINNKTTTAVSSISANKWKIRPIVYA